MLAAAEVPGQALLRQAQTPCPCLLGSGPMPPLCGSLCDLGVEVGHVSVLFRSDVDLWSDPYPDCRWRITPTQHEAYTQQKAPTQHEGHGEEQLVI